MSAHTETSDGDVVPVDREIIGHNFWQFLSDVGVHLEVFESVWSSGVEIIAG